MTSKAHALRKKLGRKVSIDELIEHEIKRAMKYPLCAAMLLMERHVAMLIMLQDSEQLGPEGVEMFNSCNRLLLKIFATTHAPDYVQHCHEHSVFLEEASEAQKRFYSLFILPMQSTGGRWRWFDRFQEDVVMDYRSVLTKNLTRGQVAKFEQAAHRIEHRASARRYGGVASMRGNVRLQEQGPNDLTNHEKLFFAKTFVESIDLNLDHGDIDQPPRIRTKEGGFTDCDDRRLYNLNGVEGNAKLFDWDSISDEVIRSYSDLYYRDNLHSPSRSEKSGVTIPRLQGTVAERTAKFNKAVKVNTSTDINDFVKGQPPTVATMSDEIHRITRILDEKSIPNEERGYTLHSERAGHPVLAEKLAAARRVLFRVDVDERERRINNLRRQMMEQGCSTEEERRDKMSGPIFKMKREVLTKEQFKAKH